MEIYFGMLKSKVSIKMLQKELKDIEVIKYYDKLRIAKFQTEKITPKILGYFVAVEIEKSDFNIGN